MRGGRGINQDGGIGYQGGRNKTDRLTNDGVVREVRFATRLAISPLDPTLPFQRCNVIRLYGSKHPAITSSMHHQLFSPFGCLIEATAGVEGKNQIRCSILYPLGAATKRTIITFSVQEHAWKARKEQRIDAARVERPAN